MVLRTDMRHVFLLLILTLFVAAVPLSAHADDWWRDDFTSLDNWTHRTFDNIDTPTAYDIAPVDGGTALRATSRAGASGITTTAPFDVYEHPTLAWRWKVNTIIPEADGTTKAGDDYPLRVYVVFTYDPDAATGLTRFKYALAKLVSGDYPPHSTLTYVWASVTDTPDFFVSPYTDQAMIIPLRRGPSQAGTWQVERVNIVEDYRRTFGEDPPHTAALAIMTDTDNTGASATAYVDWIALP